MSDVGESIDRAEGAVIDAAVGAAEQAQIAAETVTQHAAHIAATATEVAQERTDELRQEVQQAVSEQEDNLAWLREHATQTGSHLTSLTERQVTTETALAQLAERTQAGFQAILDRLTPPVSQAQEPIQEPENLSNADAAGQRAPEPEKPKREKRHNWT